MYCKCAVRARLEALCWHQGAETLPEPWLRSLGATALATSNCLLHRDVEHVNVVGSPSDVAHSEKRR